MVNEFPPTVREKIQTVEQLEADRGHDKQVCGGNSVCWVAQEGWPNSDQVIRSALDYRLGDARLRPSMPRLSSSQWIRGAPHNQLARLISRIRSRICLGITGRPPLERDFERQNALNPRQRLRADDRDGTHHGRAEPIEPDERQPIVIRQPYAPRCPPAQNVNLMVEDQVSRPAAGVATSPATPANTTAIRPSPTRGGMMTRFGSSQLNSCGMRFSVATPSL
jgi:hypothetical protein